MSTLPPVQKMMKNVTMEVTIKVPKGYRVRLAIAGWLIKLAAKVIGCKITLDSAMLGEKESEE